MTDFGCLDPIEEYLGKRVEDMDEWELISYLKNGLQALYGIDLAVEGYQERAIFKCLKKTYGEREAGLIIKWVGWKHYFRYQGSYVQFTSFSKGRKWWCDAMYAEMQDQLAREATPSSVIPEGMVSAADLFG